MTKESPEQPATDKRNPYRRTQDTRKLLRRKSGTATSSPVENRLSLNKRVTVAKVQSFNVLFREAAM